MRVSMTRKITFSSGHRFWFAHLSDEDNRKIFENWGSKFNHGHNYVLEVTLSGQVNAVTGMIVDLKDVKTILNREVIEVMDHRYLNAEVPPFDKIVPTAENIAREIWRRILPHFSTETVQLYEVRLYETDSIYVEYRGE